MLMKVIQTAIRDKYYKHTQQDFISHMQPQGQQPLGFRGTASCR